LQYDFPSQEIVIQFVIEAIQAEAFNPKTLFLIGSYTIGTVPSLLSLIIKYFCISYLTMFLVAGKERLFTEVARLLQKKIFVGAAKLQILKHLELPQEIMPWLTANEAESHIHVVPMWTLASFKRLKHLSSQYAVRPIVLSYQLYIFKLHSLVSISHVSFSQFRVSLPAVSRIPADILVVFNCVFPSIIYYHFLMATFLLEPV
jgi:hypothetical protein